MNKRKKSMSSRIEDIMYYTLEAALKTRNRPLIVLSLIPTLILFLVLIIPYAIVYLLGR